MDSLIRLKVEWFHNKQWWFGCNDEVDNYLTYQYGQWIHEDYCHYKWDIMDKDMMMAWILVYDQIPRHIYRHNSEKLYGKTIEQLRQKAVQLVNELLSHHELSTFSGHEFGFLMLPYRHSYEWKEVYMAILWTWKKIYQDKQLGRYDSIEELRPFLKATFARCPMATIEHSLDTDIYAHYIGNEHDWTIYKSKYQDILDFTPVGGHMSMELMSLKSMQLVNQVEISLKKHCLQGKPIMVSLSGGVDSMVILWILNQLKHKYALRLMAVHVNYCNRDDIEESFVVSWCTSLGVDICVRRIREIQRDISIELEIRNVYETYTRDCRYQTYREAWKKVCFPANEFKVELESNPWITMGHNQDDCFENIITNICNKQKYEELDGMLEVSEQGNGNNALTFWRPMLNIPKKEIYAFAKQALIPYLQDSTPKWSCRGRIRDNVRPALEEFNHEIVNGFFHLSDTMRELMKHIDCFVNIAYEQTTLQEDKNKDGRTVHKLHFSKSMPSSLLTSDIFWKMYLMKLWNLIVSVKSLKHFRERIERFLETNAMHKIRIVLVKGKEVWILRNECGEYEFTWYG
jgi:tRNA(Ile)-lysidine synthetase-like protein